MSLRTFFLPHEDGHGLSAMHVYTQDELAAALTPGVDTLEGTVLIAADLADALVLAYIAKSERRYPRPRVRAVTTPGTHTLDRRVAAITDYYEDRNNGAHAAKAP